MSDSNNPDTPTPESTESFDQLLSEYEKSHVATSENGSRQLEGTVIAITADSVLIDIGFKTEGILPLSEVQSANATPKPGDKLAVSVKGRDADGYYQLSRTRIVVPKDWTALEQAFTSRATLVGIVTGVVKGGLSVDVRRAGLHAGLPQRYSRIRRNGETRRAGDTLSHYQARCHR